MWEFLFRWETLWYLMLALYVPSCIGLIIIVLLQKGKSSGFAGAFGIGGGSDTVFGPRANKTLPQKLTHGMAAIFMILALAMSLVSGRLGKGVAPETLEETEMTTVDLGVLDDLGAAAAPDETAPQPEPETVPVEGSTPVEVVPESETAAPAEAEPEAEPGAVVVVPAEEEAPAPEAPAVVPDAEPVPEESTPDAPPPNSEESHGESTPAPDAG